MNLYGLVTFMAPMPKPYKFMGFRWAFISQTPVLSTPEYIQTAPTTLAPPGPSEHIQESGRKPYMLSITLCYARSLLHMNQMIRSLTRKHAGGDHPLQGRAHRHREDKAADEPANLRARMVYKVKTQGHSITL